MKKKIGFLLYYVLHVSFVVFLPSLNADGNDLESARRKPDYKNLLTFAAVDFEKWEEAAKKEQGESTIPPLTDREIDELEISRLALPKNQNSKPILPYSTYAGKFSLYHILFNPISNQEELNRRQLFIKAIFEDQQLYGQLDECLKKLAACEMELFSYWNVNDPLSQKAQSIYFSQPKTFFDLFELPRFTELLNSSSSVLELSTIKEVFKKVFFILPFLGLRGVTQHIEYAMLGVQDVSWGSLSKSFKNGVVANIRALKNEYNFTKIDHDELKAFYEGDGIRYLGIDHPLMSKRAAAFFLGYSFLFSDLTAGTRADICQNIFRKNGITFPYPIAASVTLARSILSSYLLYVLLQDHIQGITSIHTTLQNLHSRTVAVAEYIKTVEEIEQLLQNHSHKDVVAFSEQCLAPITKTSKKMKRLLSLLHSDTFKKDKSYVYLRGKVLLTHKLLKEVHTELTNRIRNMGLVDAHMAVATFMKEAAANDMPTCFVHFVPNDEPVELTISNGWSPLLGCKKPVCNSVDLGKNKPLCIILTGPNGCGKSTILRVLGVNALLALTCGVAAASEFSLSIFNSIRLSFTIKEDIVTGLSTYMAADAAGERMENHINSCSPQHRALVLYGEPYRGTPDQETSRKIMDFCKRVIEPQKDCIVAIETHVYEPTTLEKEYPHTFTNGHMEIYQDENGNFIRTFALKEGPADWWFLDHAKRRSFVDWITVVRKQEEVAQAAYRKELIKAYEEALEKVKEERAEYIKKEKSKNIVTKMYSAIKDVADNFIKDYWRVLF